VAAGDDDSAAHRGRRARLQGAGALPAHSRPVPSRRRTKPPTGPPSPPDPIEQFAALIRQSKERDRTEQERREAARRQGRAEAAAAAAHAAALEAARRDVERAIAGARDARRRGSGVAAADDAWRRAKARLIELETGVAPSWAAIDAVDVIDPSAATDSGDAADRTDRSDDSE